MTNPKRTRRSAKAAGARFERSVSDRHISVLLLVMWYD